MAGMLSSDTQMVPIILLEIQGDGNTMYFCNNGEDVIHRGNTYQSYPFKAKFPSDDKDEPKAQIQISNIDPKIIAFLSRLRKAPQITLKGVVFTPPFSNPPEEDNIEFGPASLELQSFDANAQTISGNLGYKKDFLNQKFLRWSVTPGTCPGAFKNVS